LGVEGLVIQHVFAAIRSQANRMMLSFISSET
jgi:hypothetical protein